MDTILNQIKGGMYGLAIGDALGCTYEFLNQAQVEQITRTLGKLTDIRGGGPFFLEEGDVTDDTAMSLCVARGIIKSPGYPIDAIGEEFIKWIESHPPDVGMTVRQSVLNYYDLGDWEQASLRTHNSLNGRSGGNGSLMRCLPLSLAYNNPQIISRLSRTQSKMTHHDPLAATCCVLYNRLAFLLFKTNKLQSTMETLLEETPFSTFLHSKPFNVPDTYVGNTFEWVTYLLYNTTSFEEAVVEAANQGYDSDTLASIVGGIAGLHYGFNSIPKRFSEKLLCKDELDSISQSLYKIKMINWE